MTQPNETAPANGAAAPATESVTVNVPTGYVVLVVTPAEYIRGRTRRDVVDTMVASGLTTAQRSAIRTALDERDELKAARRLAG